MPFNEILNLYPYDDVIQVLLLAVKSIWQTVSRRGSNAGSTVTLLEKTEIELSIGHRELHPVSEYNNPDSHTGHVLTSYPTFFLFLLASEVLTIRLVLQFFQQQAQYLKHSRWNRVPHRHSVTM